MVLLLLLQIGAGLYVTNHVVNSLCSQGPEGEGGPQGVQGSKGETGSQGSKGNIGPQGVQGERGPQGDRGKQGGRGPQGVRGDRGLQGDRGEHGDRGDTGLLDAFKKLGKPSILEKEVSNMIMADHPKGQKPTSGKHQRTHRTTYKSDHI